MHEFLNKNEWTDILKIEGKILVKGYKKTFKETVNKPVQLGAYILAYSRQIMTEYMDRLDPSRLNITDRKSFLESWNNTYSYGDTDSMIVHKSNMNKIELGSIIGAMSDEFEGGKKIVYIGIAPKLYMHLKF